MEYFLYLNLMVTTKQKSRAERGNKWETEQITTEKHDLQR